MSHAVHFRDATGAIRLEDVPSLDAALERVEHLRNDEEATEVRVFREVPIEVRTYYRVVAVEEPVAQAPGPPVAEAAEAPEAAVPPPAPVPPVEPPSGAMVMSRPPVAAPSEVPTEGAELAAEVPGTEHRRQLFSRS